MKLALALLLFAAPCFADTTDPFTGDNLVPIETVSADISFIPQADVTVWQPCLTVQYFVENSSDLPLSEGLGLNFNQQPFALANGALTFIPGDYQIALDFPAGPSVLPLTEIVALPGGQDQFYLWGGVYTFTLPATLLNSTQYAVPMTINAISAPEPESLAFLLIGFISLVFLLQLKRI